MFFLADYDTKCPQLKYSTPSLADSTYLVTGQTNIE
jgi:hypothetical protein